MSAQLSGALLLWLGHIRVLEDEEEGSSALSIFFIIVGLFTSSPLSEVLLCWCPKLDHGPQFWVELADGP